MSGRCPACSRTFEDCRCTYPDHDPQSCRLCAVVNRQLAHPSYGGRRPVLPGQRGAS